MPHERLFSAFTLGRFQLRNRIAVLPYGTAMVEHGVPTEGDVAHYERVARTGPALMFSGAMVVHPTTAPRSRIVVEAWDERVVPKLAGKVAALKAHGVVTFGQILHLGREWALSDSDHPPMAPSPLRSPRDAYVPREMDHGDIRTIVDAFSVSARNLQLAGYDGVEIHAAHGYLVAQFLSPATNRRIDEYGGSPERRQRFLLEVIDAIRQRCGAQFGLSVRLSASEEIVDGLEIPDTARIARALEAHGGVDLLNITMGTRGAYVKDMTAPEATAARAAIAIRRECGLPLLVGQRISTPEVAERVLAEGAADLIGMARAFFADPDWIPKAQAGAARRIRPCLNLNQDCRAFAPHLHCAVNPEVGRETLERYRALPPVATRKRVAVIGGGPGGLEAALVAARRGHDVALYEASESLGGQFLYAAAVPFRQGLKRLVDYQIAELRELGVPLHLGRRVATVGDLDGACDAAIVATGARARPLDADQAAAGARPWIEILDQGAPQPVGDGRALFVDDGTGFWWNYGVAEALVQAGWSLTLATPSAAVAHMIPHESVAPLLARLGRGHAQFRVLTALDELVPGGARLTHLVSGDDDILHCELVVVQTGRAPVAGPAAALRAGGIRDVVEIGDCITPRRMSFAVFEAHEAARAI